MASFSELRKERELSQAKVAKACGVSRSLIAAIEIGDRDPTPSLVLKISELFELKPVDIVNSLKDHSQVASDIHRAITLS